MSALYKYWTDDDDYDESHAVGRVEDWQRSRDVAPAIARDALLSSKGATDAETVSKGSGWVLWGSVIRLLQLWRSPGVLAEENGWAKWLGLIWGQQCTGTGYIICKVEWLCLGATKSSRNRFLSIKQIPRRCYNPALPVPPFNFLVTLAFSRLYWLLTEGTFVLTSLCRSTQCWTIYDVFLVERMTYCCCCLLHAAAAWELYTLFLLFFSFFSFFLGYGWYCFAGSGISL